MSSESDSRVSVVASPCIGYCQLGGDAVCEGCGRHLDEIARWSQADADEQQAIVIRAAARRAAQLDPNGAP